MGGGGGHIVRELWQCNGKCYFSGSRFAEVKLILIFIVMALDWMRIALGIVTHTLRTYGACVYRDYTSFVCNSTWMHSTLCCQGQQCQRMLSLTPNVISTQLKWHPSWTELMQTWWKKNVTELHSLSILHMIQCHYQWHGLFQASCGAKGCGWSLVCTKIHGRDSNIWYPRILFTASSDGIWNIHQNEMQQQAPWHWKCWYGVKHGLISL